MKIVVYRGIMTGTQIKDQQGLISAQGQTYYEGAYHDRACGDSEGGGSEGQQAVEHKQ